MRLSFLLALVLLALAGATPAPHPKDGPDADVEILIEERAVRVRCALNLAFVDALVRLPRGDPGAVTPAEADALFPALASVLGEANQIEIDGIAVPPVAPRERFRVLAAPEELLPLFPRFGARALAKVELELEYSAKSAPERVGIRWGPFPEDPETGQAGEIFARLVDPDSEEILTLRPDAPEHLWAASSGAGARLQAVPAVFARGPELPLCSLGLALLALGLFAAAVRARAGAVLRRYGALGAAAALAGAALARDVARVPLAPLAGSASAPAPAELLAVFRPLHANVYRAFDYRREEDIYAALEQSVDGPMLDELYNQVYRSLVNQEAGGAQSRVRSVELLDADVGALEREPLAFDVEARWRVSGSVFHWGHEHPRTYEYRARYRVAAGPKGWRLAACEVLEERRVDARAAALPPDGPAADANPLPSHVPPPAPGAEARR